MAPEYLMHGQLSVKADVFSYGVLVLELISGKKNSSFYMEPDVNSLLEWVRTENTSCIARVMVIPFQNNDDDHLVTVILTKCGI